MFYLLEDVLRGQECALRGLEWILVKIHRRL